MMDWVTMSLKAMGVAQQGGTAAEVWPVLPAER
jgi:hypothetical protein